jgi:hypothetical protein
MLPLLPTQATEKFWISVVGGTLSACVSLNRGSLSFNTCLCLQLPSDSTSRWTPLLLAFGFPFSGPLRDFNLLVYDHAGHTPCSAQQSFACARLTRHPRATRAVINRSKPQSQCIILSFLSIHNPHFAPIFCKILIQMVLYPTFRTWFL